MEPSRAAPTLALSIRSSLINVTWAQPQIAGRLRQSSLLSLPNKLLGQNTMSDIAWQQLDEGRPSTTGWYAVQYGWDCSEGAFVKSVYFDGSEFAESLPILKYSSEPFEDEYSAEEWAHNNDIS